MMKEVFDISIVRERIWIIGSDECKNGRDKTNIKKKIEDFAVPFEVKVDADKRADTAEMKRQCGLNCPVPGDERPYLITDF